MPMSFRKFQKNCYRMRALMDFIGTHLDDELRLADLAEVADLSAAHLIRVYRERVGEAPMQTLRRLRLKRAHAQIQTGRYRSLTDVGMDAGYASSAAFTHAFTRQFGIAPSALPLLAAAPCGQPPALRLEWLPPRPIWQFRYAGSYRDNGYFKTRLAWLYYLAGGRDWRGWRLNDLDQPFTEDDAQRVELAHFLPVLDPALRLAEADRVTLRGGLYACLEIAPAERVRWMPTLPARIRSELGCELTGERMIERDLCIRDYRPPQERRIALYLPVVRACGEVRVALETSYAPSRKFRSKVV